MTRSEVSAGTLEAPRVGPETTYRVIKDANQLDALKRDWERLTPESPGANVFLTYEWLTTWWKHFGNENELFLAVAERDDEVVCIAPLFSSRSRLLKKLQFLGRPGSDYSDFIYASDSPPELGPLLDYIWSVWRGDMILLEGISEDSPTFRQLAEATGRKARPTCLQASYPAPYLPILRPWEEYRKTLRKKLVQDTERQIRRLEQLGTLVFDRCLDEVSARQILDEMLAHKRARFRSTGAKDIFEDGRLPTFYREVAGVFLGKGWLDLSYMRLDDAMLALHFGFVFGGRFFYYMPSFREEYAVYSPSRLLLVRQLQGAFDDGLAEFDFLGGDDPYKYDWATDVRRAYTFSASSKAPHSRIAYSAHTRLLPMLRNSGITRGVLRRFRRWSSRGSAGS